jgi:polar amino acid transport system substrate-binding protein
MTDFTRRQALSRGAAAASVALLGGRAGAAPPPLPTLDPGTLTVLSAYPDPPFDVMQDGVATGFDIELMRAVCGRLGLVLKPTQYSGDDFNHIFDALVQGRCDAVISGTTITPEREAIIRFSRPYLVFNQGIAVNRRVSPHAASTADLRGLTAGIQSGNTSDVVARRLLAQGDIAGIRYYPYDGIATALDDLEAGRIGLVIKLFPVISWLVKDRPLLAVAMQVPTQEKLGIAFANERADLCDAVDAEIQALRDNGEFARLQERWPGTEGSA